MTIPSMLPTTMDLTSKACLWRNLMALVTTCTVGSATTSSSPIAIFVYRPQMASAPTSVPPARTLWRPLALTGDPPPIAEPRDEILNCLDKECPLSETDSLSTSKTPSKHTSLSFVSYAVKLPPSPNTVIHSCWLGDTLTGVGNVKCTPP